MSSFRVHTPGTPLKLSIDSPRHRRSFSLETSRDTPATPELSECSSHVWFGVAEDLRLLDQRGEVVDTDALAKVLDEVVNVGLEQAGLERRGGAGSASARWIR